MKSEDITKKLMGHSPEILGSGNFSKYAVLVPLIEKEDGMHVLFEERSHKLRRQPGDICFPGGKIDKSDCNELAAALRETNEELGLGKDDISHVFPIDYLVSPFGMIVYPFAGFVRNLQQITPNPAEVETIFTVPLSFFMEKPPEIYHVQYKIEPHENFPHDLIVGGENYQWQPKQMEEYFYLYKDRVIWGLTAKILTHFIEILR